MAKETQCLHLSRETKAEAARAACPACPEEGGGAAGDRAESEQREHDPGAVWAHASFTAGAGCVACHLNQVHTEEDAPARCHTVSTQLDSAIPHSSAVVVSTQKLQLQSQW